MTEKKISTSDIATVDRDEPPRPADDRARTDVQRTDVPRKVDEAPAPLFADNDASGYRTRWNTIQTGFVDEPRKAVEEADTLVAEVMKRLAEGFSDERRRLETQWEHADQVSTEDLRLAMRRYRSFFERLLAI